MKKAIVGVSDEVIVGVSEAEFVIIGVSDEVSNPVLFFYILIVVLEK